MKAAQAQRDATTYGQAQSDREDSKTADVMVNSSVDLFHAALGPTITQIQKALTAAPEPGKDASYDTHAAKTQQSIRFAINNAVNQVVQNLPKNMSPGAVSALKKQLMDDAEQNLITPFTTRYGDFKQAADAFQTHTGLAMAESYPMLAQMKALGIDYQNQKQLLDAIPQGTWKQLAGELSGAGTRSLNQNIGKIHLDRAIAVAKGELNISEVSDASARKQLLSQAYNTTVNGAAAVAAGRGSPESWGHNYAQIVLSTGGVKASDGVDVLSRALSVSARSDVRTAIERLKSNPDTADQGDLLAHASRASVGHVVQQSRAALQSLAKQQYFNLKWNENGSQFTLQPDTARWQKDHPKQSPDSIARFGYLPSSGGAGGPVASKDLVGLARNMNEGLVFLVNTTKWDPDAPRGTNRELANLYAVGTPTSAQRAAKASTRPGSNDPQHLLDLVDKSLSNVTDMVPTGNADIAGPEGTGKNPRSSASGVGQFTDGTWVDTLKKHAPELIQGKSREDIISMKQNKGLASRAIGWYRGDNAIALQDAGVPATAQTTALAHFAGPKGAVSLLKADPSAAVESVLGREAVNANPHLKGKTVAETIDWAKRFYHA
jgi:hypothetical protein